MEKQPELSGESQRRPLPFADAKTGKVIPYTFFQQGNAIVIGAGEAERLGLDLPKIIEYLKDQGFVPHIEDLPEETS